MFVSGGATGIINNLEMTLLQRTTPVAFRGRVMGLLFTASEALAPLGMIAGGLAADLSGHNIQLIYAACGALALTTVFGLSGRAPPSWAQLYRTSNQAVIGIGLHLLDVNVSSSQNDYNPMGSSVGLVGPPESRHQRERDHRVGRTASSLGCLSVA